MNASLSDLQKKFQDRLLKGETAIDAHLTDGGPFMKAYDHAYKARLVEILTEEFEGLHTLLGDEQFFSTLSEYVDAFPSTEKSARWLGRHLPGWLKSSERWGQQPVVASMAAFEWMIGLAFDAPDAKLIGVAEIGKVPPEAWPMLTFTFHPALNTVELDFDVSAFYQAAKAEEDPDGPPVAYEQPVTWAAWRDPEAMIVTYRPLDLDEAMALKAAREGQTFDGICEIVADHTDADEAAVRAAGLLRIWVESGWVIGLDAEGMSW
ncbi:MAG: putative DNA-binding domain-containing protein [Rhodospirillales bacterium]|nr:putative DNA-binding domain-containing protein [Rhodospirillales bacterium]MBO6786264.1 putative DNA-binding domain-containing protein [Rhodospirillales bacterium]